MGPPRRRSRCVGELPLVAFDVPAPALDGGGSSFEWRGHQVRLSVPGAHNARNAAAALEACVLAGADPAQAAAAALADFAGAGRRFQALGTTSSGARVDRRLRPPPDRGGRHHRCRPHAGPRRVVAVFQPHLYSRTQRLAREFGAALARADVAAVLDVYPARERAEDFPGVSGLLVAEAAADAAGGRPVLWLPTFDAAEPVLRGLLREGDLCLVMGAGDVDELGRRLVAAGSAAVRSALVVLRAYCITEGTPGAAKTPRTVVDRTRCRSCDTKTTTLYRVGVGQRAPQARPPSLSSLAAQRRARPRTHCPRALRGNFPPCPSAARRPAPTSPCPACCGGAADRPSTRGRSNLGVGGMCIATPRPLATDEVLDFDLLLSGADRVDGRARVLRQEGHDAYALRFEGLLEPARERLQALAAAPPAGLVPAAEDVVVPALGLDRGPLGARRCAGCRASAASPPRPGARRARRGARPSGGRARARSGSRSLVPSWGDATPLAACRQGAA